RPPDHLTEKAPLRTQRTRSFLDLLRVLPVLRGELAADVTMRGFRPGPCIESPPDRRDPPIPYHRSRVAVSGALDEPGWQPEPGRFPHASLPRWTTFAADYDGRPAGGRRAR